MAATFAPWRAGRVQSLEAYARTAVVNRLTGRGRRRMVAERHERTRSGDEHATAGAGRGRGRPRHPLQRPGGPLSPKQRAIIVLRYYGQLSVAETAAAIGCTEGTVKSQTHDVLAVLRVRLDRAEEA